MVAAADGEHERKQLQEAAGWLHLEPEEAAKHIEHFAGELTRKAAKEARGRPLHNRVRFLPQTSWATGPRLAAILFLLCHNTRSRRDKGKRGKACAWHQRVSWWAEQIGVSERQVRRLFATGKEINLLDYEPTGRGIRAWTSHERIWREYARCSADDRGFGLYWKPLARLLGIGGSAIYLLLKRPDEDGERRELHPEGISYRLPWLTVRAAEMECCSESRKSLK